MPFLQYNISFYLDYLARWPEYCQMAVGANQLKMGYSATPAPACAHSCPSVRGWLDIIVVHSRIAVPLDARAWVDAALVDARMQC